MMESGLATRHDASDDDNYSQPRVFYQVRKNDFYLRNNLLYFTFANSPSAK